MTSHLIDTDVFSYLARRRFPVVQSRYERISGECAISAVTAAEILFGLQAMPHLHPLRIRSLEFLSSVSVLDWPASAANVYADIRYEVRHQPLGDRDIMIASHAIAIGAILVTNNTKHFDRIGPSLKFENWLW